MTTTLTKSIKPFSNDDNQDNLPIATLVTPHEARNYER